MDNIIKNNRRILIEELESQSIPLRKEAQKLCEFTKNPNNTFIKKDDIYYLPFLDEEIPFELLSDKNINEVDKKVLLNEEKRNTYATLRTLRIAGSPLIEDGECLTIISNHIKTVVRYKRNGKYFIIDYSNNLIMKEKDYKKVFSYKVVENLSQCDIAYLDEIFNGKYTDLPLELFLIAFREITEELKKKDKSFMPNYESSGINGKNKYILDNCETLFWLNVDRESDYLDELREVFDFTINPNTVANITNNGKYYKYKDYLFRLYSDCIASSKTKDILLSDARYGLCFTKSIETAFSLGASLSDESIRIVLGKVKINPEESFCHVWVEYQAKKSKKWYAVDFTGNIIMEASDYYRFRNATIINITPMQILRGLQSYFEIYNPHMNQYLIFYFSKELLNDLEKNKTLFKGMQ